MSAEDEALLVGRVAIAHRDSLRKLGVLRGQLRDSQGLLLSAAEWITGQLPDAQKPTAQPLDIHSGIKIPSIPELVKLIQEIRELTKKIEVLDVQRKELGIS